MIKLRIKLKSESTTISHIKYLPDDYMISKANKNLQNLVEKTVKDSHLEDIEDVILTANFEW